MKRLILLPILGLTILGSCNKKFYPASVQEFLRAETRTEYIEKLRDTTIYVTIPIEVEKIVTRDTVSHLENTVAASDATVSGGLLYHSLINKHVSLPTIIQVKEVEVVRDSIVYQDRLETIIQKVNELTWWQKLWCMLGKWLTGALVLYGAFIVAKYLIFNKIKL